MPGKRSANSSGQHGNLQHCSEAHLSHLLSSLSEMWKPFRQFPIRASRYRGGQGGVSPAAQKAP